MERDDMHELAVEQVHGAHMRMAEAHSVGDNRFEDRLQIEGGVANNFEHFSGSSLLLLCLIALARSTIELFLQVGNGGMAAVLEHRRAAARLRFSGLATPCFHRFTAYGAMPSHLALQFERRTIPYQLPTWVKSRRNSMSAWNAPLAVGILQVWN